jgi:chromosome segregation ATPase
MLLLLQEKAALDGMVEKFRDFIQDNDSKKDKARQRLAEEVALIARLDQEVAENEAAIEHAQRTKQELQDRIGECVACSCMCE